MRGFLLGVLVLFALGCNYNELKQGKGGGRQGKLDGTPTDFETVKTAVLGPRCLNCHANSSGNKGNLNLETYAAVRQVLVPIAYRVLEVGDMPPESRMSEAEIRLIRNWLDEGAPEKIIGGGEKPDPDLERGPMDWSKVRDKIFLSKCLACHAGASPDAGLNLTELAVVRAKVAVIFDRVIVKQDMPVEPYPALSPRERRVLLKWIEMGMPE